MRYSMVREFIYGRLRNNEEVSSWKRQLGRRGMGILPMKHGLEARATRSPLGERRILRKTCSPQGLQQFP